MKTIKNIFRNLFIGIALLYMAVDFVLGMTITTTIFKMIISSITGH